MPNVLSFPTTTIVRPGDAGWDDARRAWNLAVDQHPAAVVLPASVQDVVEAIRLARAEGLRVAAQGTGDNAVPLGSLADTILIKPTAMRHLSVDSAARVARAEAGALSQDVTEAAAEHGLAWLSGMSPDVGVVGYTIGGGIGWLGRSYGLAANNVEAVELVTADGRIVRADGRSETDLFWALRGGGGSFGVVTAIELRLLPITSVYAGQMWWPADQAMPVMQAWRKLTQGDVPDAFTSAARLMHFPNAPAIPEHLRGRSFVILFVVHHGPRIETDALLAPLRALEPDRDTIESIPTTALGQLHMDPQQPTAAVGDALMLAGLPAEAVEAFVRAAGSEADAPPLWAELTHIGGEMKRAPRGSGALAALDADYQLTAGAAAPTPEAASAGGQRVAAVMSTMRPWAARQMYLNLATASRDPASFWNPQAYDRLRRIKRAIDPDDLIRSNHPVPRDPVAARTYHR